MNAPLSFSFETRVEELRRILITTGWEFSVWNDSADEEPRIRDTDAATRLGYAQPRDVRKLIARIWPEDRRPIQRATMARRNVRGGGVQEYTTQEHWLTEAELLKLVARSETPIAEAILDEMIAVYIAVRRHLLTTVHVQGHARKPPTPKLPASVPTVTPASRQLPAPPPPFQTLRTQTEWPWSELREGALQSDAARHLNPRLIDAAGDWPLHPGVNINITLVIELARLCRGFIPPSRLPAT